MGLADKILSQFGYHRGLSFMAFTGNSAAPPYTIRFTGLQGIRDAYAKCSPVATVANRLASSMANGRWWIVDKNSNDVSRQNSGISELIKNPNPFQTTVEFVKQIDLYRNLYGVSYVYAVVPEGFKSAGDAVCLWPVNPERVETAYTKTKNIYAFGKKEDIIEKYVITEGVDRISVRPEHILCIRDVSLDTVPFDRRKHVSRLSGLAYEVNNICQAQEAVYALNRDRGAQGIITNRTRDSVGSKPLSDDEKAQIQEEYHKKYGLSERQAKIIISDADLGWQQMSFNVKDLMLFEGIRSNIERIADAFNYPFELLSNQKGTTFANRAEAIKYLYQDNIIPTAVFYAEKFTDFFGLTNARIDIDFSHVEYLKEAEKEKAEALLRMNQALQIPYRMNVITREEYRKLLDLDEQPEGKTYYSNGNENGNGNEDGASGQPEGTGEDKNVA
jgi:HK97 family phage portal protein